MIKNNLFGTILVILMVLFLLIASIQMVGIGNGIKEVVIAEDVNEGLPEVENITADSETDVKIDNTELISKIKDRPMFNDDRLPFVEEVVEESIAEEDVVIEELKAKLTGVVITPETSYAMIVDDITKSREVYTVGMPLEGEQGGWSLSEITERKVMFTSEDNKTTELELVVYGGTAAPSGQKGQSANAAANTKAKETQEKLEKKKNADDIRKKIAERRAQMRAEALKKK